MEKNIPLKSLIKKNNFREYNSSILLTSLARQRCNIINVLSFCVVLPLLLPTTIFASTAVERLVMPGKVIQGHIKYEEDCKQCHETFSKKSQRRLCLACHKKVAEDIEKRKGFHGLKKPISEVECKHCHTEHKGRNADIVSLDKDVFDHAFTDFKLKDSHLKVKCNRCHEFGKKYRDTDHKCFTCHKKKEPHLQRLGNECADCHDERGWDKFRYDHNKTKYPLKGLHEKVACNSCHPNQRWKKTPTDCYSCHRLNDVHGGRYGDKCEKCHTPEEGNSVLNQILTKEAKTTNWRRVLYNHDATKFPLKDKHLQITCDACHTGDIFKQKLDLTCYSCHKRDDEHKGRYGDKCETCHSSKEWKKSVFDHNKTKFPLKDKHKEVACNKCHTGPVKEKKIEFACVNCHKLDDAHQKRYGTKCENCHNSKDWKKHLFNHEKTKFPLKDKHIKVACDKCHTGVIAEQKLGLTCDTCHTKDDVHRGQEGKNCEHCHNQRGWSTDVFFDHDLTKFPLIGIHAITPCEECHVAGSFKDTSMKCTSCHESKDVHKQKLGPDCALCHNPNGWNLWTFDHNTQTKFILDGAHEGLQCVACHQKSVKDKFRQSTTCFACHLDDDAHFGRFGRKCDRCHVTKNFKQLKITT